MDSGDELGPVPANPDGQDTSIWTVPAPSPAAAQQIACTGTVIVSRFRLLAGIAKGYGVDRLAEVAADFGISGALVAIDGELRAIGLQSDGAAWTVAIERPDPVARAPYTILALHDAAVATSGDYRHWVDRR